LRFHAFQWRSPDVGVQRKTHILERNRANPSFYLGVSRSELPTGYPCSLEKRENKDLAKGLNMGGEGGEVVWFLGKCKNGEEAVLTEEDEGCAVAAERSL
jgi:hypothetical protein